MIGRVLRRSRTDDAQGFTLIELMVTLGLFSILLAVFGAGTSIMFKDVRRSQGQSDNLDGSRRVVQQMDKQVRYANAINSPGPGGVAGATYIEWRQGLLGERQTCVQWRLTADGVLGYRTWKPIRLGANGLPDPVGQTLEQSEWIPRADGITPPAVGALFTLPTSADASSLTKQKLTVAFRSTHGKPPLTTSTSVGLTALNTKSAAPLLVPVCSEVPRS